MSNALGKFEACEICGVRNWEPIYQGAIRDGVFGAMRDAAVVAKCKGCGIHRLDEEHCLGEEEYENNAYRKRLGQSDDLTSHYASHDHVQIHALNVIKAHTLRNLTVVDVGAGGGSFLDHISGLAQRTIAIEPADGFRRALKERSYEAYAYASDATNALGSVADVAISLQVIEHVRDPLVFLSEVRDLLKPGGRLILSTPNRKDILLDLLQDTFPSFFYRVVHRWYFDASSLTQCAEKAGFVVEETRHVHRYGMANMLLWLRDRTPKGNARMDGIDALADGFWKSYLETTGRSDTLFMILKRN